MKVNHAAKKRKCSHHITTNTTKHKGKTTKTKMNLRKLVEFNELEKVKYNNREYWNSIAKTDKPTKSKFKSTKKPSKKKTNKTKTKKKAKQNEYKSKNKGKSNNKKKSKSKKKTKNEKKPTKKPTKKPINESYEIEENFYQITLVRKDCQS